MELLAGPWPVRLVPLSGLAVGLGFPGFGTGATKRSLVRAGGSVDFSAPLTGISVGVGELGLGVLAYNNDDAAC